MKAYIGLDSRFRSIRVISERVFLTLQNLSTTKTTLLLVLIFHPLSVNFALFLRIGKQFACRDSDAGIHTQDVLATI